MESIRTVWRGVVDFITLTAILYSLLRLGRLVRTRRNAAAVGFVYGAAIAAWHIGLAVAARAIEGWVFVAAALSAVVFQPEIGGALVNALAFSRVTRRSSETEEARNREIARAVFRMARERTGALIVLIGPGGVDENLVACGVAVDEVVSAALLRRVFRKCSPMHDGAVLIRGRMLERAKAILPLTDSAEVPVTWGTRHRAAMGITERTDALAIAVSEQRGEVMLMARAIGVVVEGEDELVRVLCTASQRGTAFRQLTRSDFRRCSES